MISTGEVLVNLWERLYRVMRRVATAQRTIQRFDSSSSSLLTFFQVLRTGSASLFEINIQRETRMNSEKGDSIREMLAYLPSKDWSKSKWSASFIYRLLHPLVIANDMSMCKIRRTKSSCVRQWMHDHNSWVKWFQLTFPRAPGVCLNENDSNEPHDIRLVLSSLNPISNVIYLSVFSRDLVHNGQTSKGGLCIQKEKNERQTGLMRVKTTCLKRIDKIRKTKKNSGRWVRVQVETSDGLYLTKMHR